MKRMILIYALIVCFGVTIGTDAAADTPENESPRVFDALANDPSTRPEVRAQYHANLCDGTRRQVGEWDDRIKTDVALSREERAVMAMLAAKWHEDYTNNCNRG